MHTIWKGTISFGLVSIPIKLHAATENKDLSLRTLHNKCHAPIKYSKVCSACGEEVAQEDIVKAYEYVKGKYVVLDDEELEALKKEQEEKAVEIIDFVNIDEIDPIYYERSYYMSPNEGGIKAYSLLRKALEQSGKVGVAKITVRSKESMAVIRVLENTLLMETIHFPDEVRKAADVPNIPEADNIVQKELETAILLIDQLTTSFDPEKYHDEYRSALMELIEKKKHGQTVTPKQRQDGHSNVVDLMAALQASIDQTKPAAKTTRKRAPRKKKETS